MPDAQWLAPKITLSHNDKLCTDLNLIDDRTTIYRGMSASEFISKAYRQSWTLDPEIAEKFAFTTYYDFKENHMVAQTKIKKEDIIYIDLENPEREVIVCTDGLYGVKQLIMQTKSKP